MIEVMEITYAGMVCITVTDGWAEKAAPSLIVAFGSLDDFNSGSVLLFDTETLRKP